MVSTALSRVRFCAFLMISALSLFIVGFWERDFVVSPNSSPVDTSVDMTEIGYFDNSIIYISTLGHILHIFSTSSKYFDEC